MAEGNLVGVVDRIQRLLECLDLKDITEKQRLDEIKKDFSMLRGSFDDAELKKKLYSDKLLLKDSLADVDDLLTKMLALTWRTRHVSAPKKLIMMMKMMMNTTTTFFNSISSKMDNAMQIVKQLQNSSVPEAEAEAEAEEEQRGNVGGEIIVVGRDHHLAQITEKLLKKDDDDVEDKNLMVIPIVGIGGVGKTIIAMLICDDQRVKSHFDLTIWVSLGVAFDVKAIMKQIISFITHNYPTISDFKELQALVFSEIRRKRFLLVLDDVPPNVDEHSWKVLTSEILSVGTNGSRIIVTTRHTKVAEITGKNQLYHLEELHEKEAWLLFQKVAVREEEELTDPEMIEIGQGIAKRCRGIPLLITAIGSLLRIKKTKQEWKSFFHEFSMIIETENNAFAILQLSYDHLPFALKDCFAYCAIFPKDYEIDVDTLITLWMSQGFIVITESDQDQDNNEQQDLERLGYKYFVDLHGRCFFHEIEQDELGYIKKCRMPNLMHDLAKQIAGKAYATLILKEDSIDDATLVRHVSFDFHLDSSWQISIPSSDLKRIRSLFLPWQYQRAIEGGSSQSICDVIPKFEWLRMLDLHNTGIKKLPDSISELKLLCYLDLSQNGDIKALPKSICGLYFLQTLKLNHCSNLQTLPRGITRLFNLRHLENKSCHCLTRMPRGLSQLSNLRTLSEFGLSKDNPSKPNGKLDELSCLNYLRGEIKIKNLRNPKDDKTAAANMKGKKDVLSLILIWDINSSVNEADCEEALEDLEPHPNLRELSISTYGGSKFPSWLPVLKKLVKLSISRCNRCHCLPRLDQLTNLQVLVVDELMNLEYIMDETSTKTTLFSTLKELRLTNLPKLKGWCKDNSCENATFSCLSRLVVEDCPCLISMPLFPCLQELLVLKNTSWKPFKRTVTTATEEKRALTSQLEVSSSSPMSSSSPLSSSSPSNTLTKSKSRRSPRRTKSLNMKPKSPSFKKVSRPKPVSSTVALDSTLKTPVPAPQNISSTAIVTPLSKLRTLHIIDMPNSDPNMWKSLHSLRSVTLDNVADINDYLKGGLRQVTSLQQLHILRCYNLVEIESWIDDFKTLSKISIKLCPQLRIPHDRIDLITSSNVKVEHCPRVTHIERVLQDQLHMIV